MNDIAKPEAKNEIVVYQPNETMRLEVQLRDDGIWLTARGTDPYCSVVCPLGIKV